MIIELDTAKPLSETDRHLLRVLLNDYATPPLGEATEGPSETVQVAGGTSAPASAPRRSETPPEAPETPSGPDPALLDEATSRATALIRAKQGNVVQDALEKIGVEKVTKLDNDVDLRAFLAKLP